jgi:hypothetical protein
MVARVNRRILLKSRPEGAPSLDNFALKQGSVAGARRRRSADAHALALARSLYARPHECGEFGRPGPPLSRAISSRSAASRRRPKGRLRQLWWSAQGLLARLTLTIGDFAWPDAG